MAFRRPSFANLVRVRRVPRLSEIPETTTEREFWELFGGIEYEQLDFKESANHLKEVIPAMAMTVGGMVLCGVADDRRLVGCPLDQKTLDRIMRAGHDAGVEVQAQSL